MKRTQKDRMHTLSDHEKESMPSPFLEGVGSLLDLFGTNSDLDSCFIHDDLEALASDWKKVGQDFWHGFNFK